jgi:hypothetical protein
MEEGGGKLTVHVIYYHVRGDSTTTWATGNGPVDGKSQLGDDHIPLTIGGARPHGGRKIRKLYEVISTIVKVVNAIAK